MREFYPSLPRVYSTIFVCDEVVPNPELSRLLHSANPPLPWCSGCIVFVIVQPYQLSLSKRESYNTAGAKRVNGTIRGQRGQRGQPLLSLWKTLPDVNSGVPRGLRNELKNDKDSSVEGGPS